MNPKAEIARLSVETGFDAVRFARWDAVLDQTDRLERWLANGYSGDMGYLERKPKERCNPRSLLKECNTVIVCAVGYYTEAPENTMKPHPFISRYAWGDDYHIVLREKLKRLGTRISEEIANHEWKPTVDTSPVLEKAFGEASGIGWRGKHSLIINPELGSWFFIGLILTSLELEPDDPLEDGCRGCKACMDVCPTGALVAPRVLAAHKCISYQTTECREPPNPQTDLKGWLYGCDLCQLACPHNHPVRQARESRFSPERGIENISPADVLKMNVDSFDRAFGGTVIRRRKLWRMQAQARCNIESDATLVG